MNQATPMCTDGLGLLISWGQCLATITVFGQNTPAARIAAERAKRKLVNHQKKCKACKVIEVEKAGEK